jgi:hypothetical protein
MRYRICWRFAACPTTRSGYIHTLEDARELVDEGNHDRSGSHWIEDENGVRVYPETAIAQAAGGAR